MSEKRNVPTFRVFCTNLTTPLEGPVVSPDKKQVALHVGQLHNILRQNEALLIYAKEWYYIPAHSVERILRGRERFNLPWPLTEEKGSDD